MGDTEAKTTKKPRKTKKQGELPGIEKPKHPELDTLLERQAEVSSALGEARQELGEINDSILAAMEKLKLDSYRHDTAVPPILVTRKKGADKVKVKRVGAVAVDEAEVVDE